MKTRSIKELFQFVLTEGNKDFKNDGARGLCGFSVGLLGVGKINYLEHRRIKRYIETHRPIPGDIHYRSSCEHNMYYWYRGTWTPRKKWLKDQIKNM
jgi:hypothetical protein